MMFGQLERVAVWSEIQPAPNSALGLRGWGGEERETLQGEAGSWCQHFNADMSGAGKLPDGQFCCDLNLKEVWNFFLAGWCINNQPIVYGCGRVAGFCTKRAFWKPCVRLGGDAQACTVLPPVQRRKLPEFAELKQSPSSNSRQKPLMVLAS